MFKTAVLKYFLTLPLTWILLDCDTQNISGNNSIDFGIYAGTGSWNTSAVAVAAAVCSSGFSAEFFYDNEIFRNAITKYRAIILPGGDPSQMSAVMDASGRNKLKDFVLFGGGLIALGGGAAICDTGVFAAGIDVFPGRSRWPVERIVGYPDLAMTDITQENTGHEILSGLRPRYWTLYRWGPEFLTNDPGVTALYRYELTGTPAAVAFTREAGRVFLCGCQLEIEENSPRDGTDFGSEWNDSDSEWDILQNAMFWCLGQVF